MKLFSPADEVLPYKRPEKYFFLSEAINCESFQFFLQIGKESEKALEFLLKHFLWNNWKIFSLKKLKRRRGDSGGIQTQICNWPIYIKIAA